MSTTKGSRRKPLAVSGGLWLNSQGRNFLGGKRIALLEAIADKGSITHAAQAVGLSYKGAWDMVDAMNNLAEQPLVTRGAGGKGGGGTRITDYGTQVITLYRQLAVGHQKVMQRMTAEMHDTSKLSDLIHAIAMKTSARNQLRGVVSAVRKGAVNADVMLDLGDGLQIFANITNDAVADLGLKKGRKALALIKSSFVLLSTDHSLKISARNQLRGVVASISKGAVNSEVKLTLPGDRSLVAIVTDSAVRDMGLKVGGACCAVINASHVLIAVND